MGEETHYTGQQALFLTKYSEQVFQKPLASRVSCPTEKMAFVVNHFEYSTDTLSHEILHLVLEEQGNDKACYVDMLHENRFRFELKEMGENMLPVMKRFQC